MKKYITDRSRCGMKFEMSAASDALCSSCRTEGSVCVDCGAGFDASLGRGRPRIRCFSCSPSKETKAREQEWVSCGWCESSFLAKTAGSSFCSPECQRLDKGPDCAVCGERVVWYAKIKMDGSAAHQACRRDRPAPCGTLYGYRSGCRCDECRGAVRDKSRRYNVTYKAEHGISPTAKYRRLAKGLPLESESCRVCGEPMVYSYFREGATPAHKSCVARPHIPQAVRDAVYERDSWSCHLCGESVDPDAAPLSDWYPSLDHVVPWSQGGTDDPDNLRTAHRWCNGTRGVRPIEEFAELLGVVEG